MQEEINLVYELADNLCGDSNVTVDELCAFADKYNAPCEYSREKSQTDCIGAMKTDSE